MRLFIVWLAAVGLALAAYLILRYLGDTGDKLALTGAVVIGMLAGYLKT